MVSFREKWRGIFAGAETVQPGVHHYRRDLADRQMRLHLRIDEDGSGILSVNASGIIHLNATAIALMKQVLDGKTKAQAVAGVRKEYRVSRQAVEQDYDRILEIIDHLETTEDACPIASLNVPSVPPFGKKVAAPYRADLALNYECNNVCQHCYVARSRDEVKPMALEEWKRVLEKVWDVGVPHVCFTGGEATLSEHLVELIEKAEDIGIITGLLTNGRKLSDRMFTQSLCAAGLDHVQITIESHDAKVHDGLVGALGAFEETVQGIKNALEEDIYLVTNTTLCRVNVEEIERTLEFLKGLGVQQFAMNSIIYTGKAETFGLGIEECDLDPILGLVAEKAGELGLRFIWYSPTRYCELDPVSLGIGFKRCTAAEYNICIEPDGQVLPCQSFYKPVGHILKDDWKSIWESPLFVEIRDRVAASAECRECPDFEVCGAGCPLNTGDIVVCVESHSEG